MRADRLLSLLLLLQSRGRMTAQALAEHLEVSERTIYRDIEALSFAGVPLYTERGPGGGCELLDGYQTTLTGLTLPEVDALFLLSSGAPLADLGLEQALKDALIKLSAVLPAPSREHVELVRQRFYMDTTHTAPTNEEITHLKLLQEAIWHDITVYLTYSGYHRCAIEPYGLVAQNGAWYLVGARAGVLHVVCVAHIQAAEITELHFTHPTTFDLASYWTEHASASVIKDAYKVIGRRQAHKKAKTKVGFSVQTSSRNVLCNPIVFKKTHFVDLAFAA